MNVSVRWSIEQAGLEGRSNFTYMKKDICALSFSEKERICEKTFIEHGPYWHLYTDGTRMQDIFCTDEDMDIGMWILASAVCSVKDVKIITFEIMSNHVHKILSGKRESCIKMFDLFKARLKRVMNRRGRMVEWDLFNADILQIETLRTLRNEIIYANRNAYVANPRYTPDSYPWGGGCAYFNAWTNSFSITPFTSLTIDRKRELTHSRDISDYDNLQLIGQRVFIPSFCDIRLGEALFTDPRSYFNALTRNAEAFSQIAEHLKDSIFMTDDEMYSVAISHINKEYGIRNISHLTPQQKIECARHLRFMYNATRQQLRRILKLEDHVLSELFP